jgi:HK97 family phage major capsid protein
LLQQNHEEARERAMNLKTRLISAAAAEGRELGEGEIAAINRAVEEANSIKRQLDRARDTAMTAAINAMVPGRSAPSGRPRGGSLGEQFIASETFEWLRRHRGSLPQGPWTSPASELGGTGGGVMLATTITEDPASGGKLVAPQYLPGIIPLPQRPLVIRDLMMPGTTDSNTVVSMKETSVTNAAAAVAEGAAKPESTIVFDAVNEPVRKIATWIPVTDEMMEDVPAFSAYIDGRLRLFVQLAEDSQLLSGDGTAPNLSGILDRPGIAAPIARTTDTNSDVVLRQISAIQTATNLLVDGVVMHPTNWNSVLLLKAADGTYIAGGGPLSEPGPKSLWGRPVALTTAMTLNSALVGAFKSASQWFSRGGIRVEASNSHQDYFIKNLVAIRAEERLALCVYRENAFGLVTNLT